MFIFEIVNKLLVFQTFTHLLLPCVEYCQTKKKTVFGTIGYFQNC